MNRVITLLNHDYKQGKIGNLLFIFTIALLYLFCALGFSQLDQIVNASHSVLFWDSLVHGRVLQAYQDAIDIIGSDKEHFHSWPMCYEPVSYLILGIMNLPAVISYEIGTLKFNSLPFYLFVKWQQITMIFIASLYVYKIAKLLSENNKTIISFSTMMFMSCPGLIYFSIAFGQIEIYALTFSLIGLYYWLNNDNIKFVVFFAISVTFKLFPFLIFIPLVLIREKKLIRIIIYCYSCLFLLIISKLLYCKSDAYISSLAESHNRINGLISVNSFITGLSFEHVSIFIICLLIACLCAYITNIKCGSAIKKTQQEKIWGIYYCFVVLVVFFILVPGMPYWSVILAPFIPLLTTLNPKKRHFNIVLSILFWGSYLFVGTFNSHNWTANFDMVGRMSFPHIFGFAKNGMAKYFYLSDFFKDIGISQYCFLANAIYIGALISLAIVNCPKVNNIPLLFDHREKTLLILRALVIVPLIFGLVFIYYEQNDVILDTTKVPTEKLNYNIFRNVSKDNKEVFRQILTFKDNYEINSISINLSTPGQNFTVYGSIIIKLVDDFSRTELYIKKIGYNQIAKGEPTRIKIPNVIVSPNINYSLIIQPDRYMPVGEVYVIVTKDKKLPGSLLYQGNDVEKNLSIKIQGKKYRVNKTL